MQSFMYSKPFINKKTHFTHSPSHPITHLSTHPPIH